MSGAVAAAVASCFTPPPSGPSVAYNGVEGHNTVGFATALDVSVAVPASGLVKPCLFVFVNQQNSQLSSAPTWNGTAMTLEQDGTNCSAWRIVAPASGTHNVHFATTGLGDIHGSAVLLENVNQSTPTTTANNVAVSNVFQTNPRSDNITLGAGDMALDFMTGSFEATDNLTPTGSPSAPTELSELTVSGPGRSSTAYELNATAMGRSWAVNPSNSITVRHLILAVKAG